MKRIELKNGDFIEFIPLKESIKINVCDKMGYIKELKFFTNKEILELFELCANK